MAHQASLVSLLLVFMAGCGSGHDGQEIGAATGGSGVATGSGGAANGAGGSTGMALGGAPNIAFGGATGGPAAGGASMTCTADFAQTELRPIYLAFAFDVSGSMGKLDKPYYDPELKWKPVVAATRAFFEDASSSGIRASLTFFPAEDDKCKQASYEKPDVDLTPLPSNVFGAAIDDITPKTSADWRGGTPTMAVLRGTAQFLKNAASADPSGKYAMVLVSDGYPEGCSDDDDSIDAVANAVEDVAADMPTYVIGVSNPPGGPDTVSNLNQIAEAGGTDHAFVIQTGDPAKTTSDFKAAIDGIRGAARSCEAVIPPQPGGAALDQSKVNVSARTSAGVVPLQYDPDCRDASAWRYDDATNPTRIVLCEQACADAQSDTTSALSVEFGCDTREVPR